MSNHIENHEQNNSVENGTHLPEQAISLKKTLENIEVSSKKKGKEICQNYPNTLPSDPTKVPAVRKIDEECDQKVNENNREHSATIKEYSSQFAKLEKEVADNYNNQSVFRKEAVENVSVADIIKKGIPKSEATNGRVPENRETGLLDIA